MEELLALNKVHGPRLLGESMLFGDFLGLARPGTPFPLRPSSDWPPDPPFDALFWLDDAGWQALQKGRGWRRYQRYRQEMEAVAEHWGLRAPWGPVAMHSIIMGAWARLWGEARSFRQQDAEWLLEWRGLAQWLGVVAASAPAVPVPAILKASESAVKEEEWLVNEPWDRVERRIVDELRRVRDSIREMAKESGVLRQQDTRPRLGDHVRWLFLRICPQKPGGRPLSWSDIAERDGVPNTETIRDPVRSLAHELGIALPRLPPGRRPRFTD